MELLEANPNYAHVRYPDGRKTTVSIKHLAPKGQSMMSQPTPEVGVEEDHLAPGRASMSQPTPEVSIEEEHLAPDRASMSQPTPEVSVEEDHLAPGRASMSQPTPEVSVEEEHLAPDRASMSQLSSQPVEEHPTTLTPVEQPPHRRSERIRPPPDRLNL